MHNSPCTPPLPRDTPDASPLPGNPGKTALQAHAATRALPAHGHHAHTHTHNPLHPFHTSRTAHTRASHTAHCTPLSPRPHRAATPHAPTAKATDSPCHTDTAVRCHRGQTQTHRRSRRRSASRDAPHRKVAQKAPAIPTAARAGEGLFMEKRGAGTGTCWIWYLAATARGTSPLPECARPHRAPDASVGGSSDPTGTPHGSLHTPLPSSRHVVSSLARPQVSPGKVSDVWILKGV